jgi:predicted RNA-binding protein
VSAIRDGGLEDSDIVIVSELCAIVPPEYRLSVPAANYDFPPEYTVKDEYPEVFNIFTDRLAEWMDKMDYETIYPFLISGHQSKFDAAMEKMETNPTVHTVPSASFNPETGSYSGDRFKTLDDITMKVRAVLSVRAGKDVELPEKYGEFYADRWD